MIWFGSRFLVGSRLLAIGCGSFRTFERATELIPPSQTRAAFNSLAALLFGGILANLEENKTLAHLRDLLLPKLMSGEIRLDDAAKLAEEVT